MLDCQSLDTLSMVLYPDEDTTPDPEGFLWSSQGELGTVPDDSAVVAVLSNEAAGLIVFAPANVNHVHHHANAPAFGILLPLPTELGSALGAGPDHDALPPPRGMELALGLGEVHEL
jgi:hypothetical protein